MSSVTRLMHAGDNSATWLIEETFVNDTPYGLYPDVFIRNAEIEQLPRGRLKTLLTTAFEGDFETASAAFGRAFIEQGGTLYAAAVSPAGMDTGTFLYATPKLASLAGQTDIRIFLAIMPGITVSAVMVTVALGHSARS